MSSIKVIKEKLKKFRWPYFVYREIVRQRADRKVLWDEAVGLFEKEKPEQGSLSDYKQALFKHRVSYMEYMYAYEFWRLDDKKRKDFISEKGMRCVYRKTVKKSVVRNLDNKLRAHQVFEKYMHRKWMYVPNTSLESFKEFVGSMDCIVKPVFGTLGKGIMKIKKDDAIDLKGMYDYCCENRMMVEECVRSNKELEAFHPGSLNTIRVVTVSKGGKCELLGALLRMGVGNSIVDNTSAGGVFAPVDLDTGALLVDGVDNHGNKYVTHPDSGKAIKGFVIPEWKKVVGTCKELTKVIPEMVFAGWDVCVLEDGRIELIEGNSGPNVHGGLQAPLKRGLKPRLSAIGKEVLGYDPVGLISVWSRSYVSLDEKCPF